MPTVDLVIEGDLSRSVRVRQLEAMFDVPASEKIKLAWQGEMPIEERDWNVGLIVGASGSGKTSIMRKVFGEPRKFKWTSKAVIDDFTSEADISAISSVCQAVGFNTIPAWMRPFAVLSNGEKFRVEIARHLLEDKGTIVIDEFTSVVDRQVAKIASHAVAKYIRKEKRQIVVSSCHYDIVDWLQPDWTFEPATMCFTWRVLRRRPELHATLSRIDRKDWKIFAPFHYLSAELHQGAQCFGLRVDGTLASFVAVLHRPHAKSKNIKAVTRSVTLPDWQGIGLCQVLRHAVAAAYKSRGFRLRLYPAHPSLIRSHQRHPDLWRQVKEGGTFGARMGGVSRTSTLGTKNWKGTRQCAVFEYVGEAMSPEDANILLADSA